MNTPISANKVNDQREALCLELQQNRRAIKRAIGKNETEFPRSLSMRFITENKVAIAIYIFRIAARRFSFIHFIERKLERNNYIEHSKVK